MSAAVTTNALSTVPRHLNIDSFKLLAIDFKFFNVISKMRCGGIIAFVTVDKNTEAAEDKVHELDKLGG